MPDHISKHQEKSWKHEYVRHAAHYTVFLTNFEVFGNACGQTRPWMFDITYLSKLKLRRERRRKSNNLKIQSPLRSWLAWVWVDELLHESENVIKTFSLISKTAKKPTDRKQTHRGKIHPNRRSFYHSWGSFFYEKLLQVIKASYHFTEVPFLTVNWMNSNPSVYLCSLQWTITLKFVSQFSHKLVC